METATKGWVICLSPCSSQWLYPRGVEGSGKTVEVFLYNPKMIMILVITVLVLVPICYCGARWMFNYAYGKHLKKLKNLIDELS